MDRNDVVKAAQAYLDANWPAMVDDIAKLVEVPSIEELDLAEPGAPFGPGPAAALAEALKIADGLGFRASNVDGYVGYADLPGATDVQIGMIGHVDVVPAGKGWNFEPYTVSIKDGYLLGRGVLDDKGPSVMALHAMKCLKDMDPGFKYTIRFIFGANEETGMGDVPYYRARYADPAFLFTPDAEFPVCYGEKGGFDATITSTPIDDPVILEFSGGSATNAVPGFAEAVVRAKAPDLPAAEGVKVEFDDRGRARIEAAGRSAHAATPENGVNAIAVLVDYLLENDLCNAEERAFLEFQKKLLGATDGSGIGIATADEYFGPLTIIGGTVAIENGSIVQTCDSRFPTSIEPGRIFDALCAAAPKGAKVENTLLMEPFLVKPDTPEIVALLDAYNFVTGEEREPFTIGGGTYAREFTKGASFGPEMPWLPLPEWAGGIHGPNEAVSIEQLKQAFVIYAVALFELEQLDLG